MKHHVEFWHGERERLVDYVLEQAPYLPPLKSEVVLKGKVYLVGSIRSIFAPVIVGHLASDEGWTVQVTVYRTEAELPTSPQFGR